MSLRRKTVRRLMILLAAVVVMVATVAALYLRNEHRKSARLAESRSRGMEAFEAQDYQACLDAMKYYVARVKNDTDALYAYGVSRSSLETPNGTHLSEGINVFTTILQIDPAHLDAKHRLLDLYTQVGYSNEASELADRVLVENPDDKEALRAKVNALYRLRKYDDALLVSEKLNELDPHDLEMQLFTYQLMRSLRRPQAQLLARAQQQQQAHPDDPRFELLLAWVYGDAGDMTNCLKWLNTAAERPAPDATYVRYMVRVLDQLKLYEQSQSLLDRAVADNPDPLIGRILIQRLWQRGKPREVIDRLRPLNPDDATSDSGLLAYKALALFESNQREPAEKIVQTLAQRKSDPEAMAWATALEVRFNPTEPKKALEQYQAALGRSPENSVIRYLVGETYLRLGETELAIAAWKRAADLAPSWPTPHIELAKALAAGGRLKEAVREAYNAYLAAPRQPATVTLLINTRYKALEEGLGDTAGEASLLKLVEELQRRVPGEAETLPIYVNLLARAGRKTDAVAAVETALQRDREYSAATMLRLIAASRTHNLGLEEKLQAAGGGDDDNPRVVLARAADLAASGKPLDGLALIQKRATSATTQPVQWQLALNQYKEIIRDASVAKDWVALGDAHPRDLSLQLAILKTATSARADRQFMSRTIDRVREMTGPDAQAWKLERARWLLGSDSSKDAAEAVNTLSEIVRSSPRLIEARLLLAAAYEMVGRLPAATKEYQTAAEQDPGNEAILMDAARLLQAQNRFDEARPYLERAASSGDLTADMRRRVCGMLTVQGDFDRATQVLESAKDLDVTSQLLLADIYRRQNRNPDAEAVYARLLSMQPPAIDAIRGAADFYASLGKAQQAEKVLSRLPQAKPRPGIAELVLAAWHEKWGSADIARRQYQSAAVAAPTDPTPWRQLIAFHLRGGRYDDARQAAQDALAAASDDADLKRLADVTTKLAQLASSRAALRPVAQLLASSPEDRGVVELLTRGSESSTQPTTSVITEQLKETIARHPRSLPLRLAYVQALIAGRQFKEAALAAAEAMDTFPTDPDAARIATNVYRLSRQWDLAANAARRWRERTPDRPAAADAALAEIELARGDAAASIKVLAPYAAQLVDNPQGDPPAFSTLMHAYARGGRIGDARAALEPLLAQDRKWRLLWLQIAGEEIPASDVAADWITHAAPLAADDAERLALARAWYNLAARSDHAEALDAAATTIDPLAARTNAPAEIVLLRAAIADRAGDADASQAFYRRGLQLTPNHPGALNNLAYLILQNGGDVNEAKTLATRAVELAPNNATFHDTLARIHAKAGDRDAAIAAFERALKLQPDNLEAMIGMASALSDAGKHDAAADWLTQINTLLKARPALSPQLQRELDALRATVKASL